MSQFNSLSDDFKDSLLKLADNLKHEARESENPRAEDLSFAHEFVDKTVGAWYSSLDEDSRAGVRALFAELNKHSPDDVLVAMKGSGDSPFGFIGKYLKTSEASSEKAEETPGEED